MTASTRPARSAQASTLPTAMHSESCSLVGRCALRRTGLLPRVAASRTAIRRGTPMVGRSRAGDSAPMNIAFDASIALRRVALVFFAALLLAFAGPAHAEPVGLVTRINTVQT